MTTIVSATGSATPASVITGCSDWRTAVEDLIRWLIANGRCFSSGELAAVLRSYRPDLVFSVLSVGENLRDSYYNGGFPSYDDDGQGTVYPVMTPRTTIGRGRTPAGVQVFVYGPDQAAGEGHDFEVDIPQPGGQAVDGSVHVISDGTPVPQSMASKPQVPAPGAAVRARVHTNDTQAYVRPDRRLCLNRGAFEAYVHVSGRSLKGGDPVYVGVSPFGSTGYQIKVTLDQEPGSVAYDLWKHTGRIAFKAPTGYADFNPGDHYSVNVTSDGITIDVP